MKQSFKRLASLILALMLVIGALIVFFQFTQPEYQEIQVVKGEQAGRLAFIEKQESAITQVKKLIAAYKSDLDFQLLVSTSFPIDTELSSAISQITGLVELNNLFLKSFSIQNSKPGSQSATQRQSGLAQSLVRPIGALSFKLELLGTYEDLKNFIGSVETNVRIFDVKSLSLAPAVKSNQNLYNSSVEVATYYQGQE